jgi:oligopeptidase B
MTSTRRPDPPLPAPPVAPRIPKVDIVHGDRRVDHYFWLREKARKEVTDYLEAENAYTEAALRPTLAFQDALYREMLGRIKETDLSVPYPDRGYFYYSRTEEGKQYPILCRKTGGLEAAEEITLDLNELAAGKAFMALGAYAVSDDGTLLAYSTDETGFREYTLFLKDLGTGDLGPERIEKTGSVAWASDSRTLFYTVEDPAKRPYRLYRHLVGDTRDVLVHEEADERFLLHVSRSRSRSYLFLTAGSHTMTEVRYLASSDPEAVWGLVAPRERDHEYEVDHHDDLFYIRTNDTGRNFRLVTAPVSRPNRSDWREVVPHRENVMLEGVELFASHVVLLEREGGLPHMRVQGLKTPEIHRIAFPEPAYSAFPGTNAEWETTAFRYQYESFVTPTSVFEYDMAHRESKLLKQTEVLGGHDPSRYASERLSAKAPDGTLIPISLVHRKDTRGDPPMVLYGYGAYGIPIPVTFSSNRLSLLDRGVSFAIAHVRGGGEMGKVWHDEGRMMKKRNTFTDFIAAAEHLLGMGYVSRGGLIIEGASAGGLLLGAVVNMRPELFKAVVSRVPFVDVMNTMLDPSLPLTVGEYEEWGNPLKKDEYDYMKTYCPYTNLEAKDYPTMLVKTSFNDSQVMYWEPAKYVAKLRTLKTDDNPLLLKTNMAAGHGGASGRYDFLREVALDYAFMLAQCGITA